jgi:hypothetical protein
MTLSQPGANRERSKPWSSMTWPPQPGELLPRAAEAVGVREKLVGYSLDMDHRRGGPKARGFQRILGITIGDVDYLEGAIRAGILVTPIGTVRPGAIRGFSCTVEVPVRGLDAQSSRTANVRTAWEIAHVEATPRLVTAFLRP